MMRIALIWCCLLSSCLWAKEKPNILIILVDDLGWRDTGYMGSDFYETPNIDRLASEGMYFTNAYAAAANCAPARASLLAGQYTPRHKIYNVGTDPRGKAANRRLEHIPGTDTLDRGIKTWAQVARNAGYHTATVGKWHLSHDPLPYGFDINIGGSHSGSPPNGYYPPHPGVPGLKDAPEDEYLTDRLSQEAVDFIKAKKGEPWLLYLSHFAVHTPLEGKRELIEKYQNKNPGERHSHVDFATMVQSVDDGVGNIMKTLVETGQDENTFVLFYSDNGGFGPATDMDPLKGYKGTYYEGGIRVPLAIRWKGRIQPGKKSDAIVTGVDMYPTICEAMGVELPADQTCDGMSLFPILKGDPSDPERTVFWHFPAYLQSYPSVVDEQRDPLFRSRPCSVVRSGDWKLIYYYEDHFVELFNLKKDIGETINLASREVEKAGELYALLDEWRNSTGADIPRHPNFSFDPQKHCRAIEKKKIK